MGTSPHTPLPIAEADFTQTGYSYTLSLIQGKHKMVILYCLMEYEPVRFNEMRRYLGRISDKTLSVNLKELERDGLIARTEYPQIPPESGVLAHGSGRLSHGSARPNVHLGRNPPPEVGDTALSIYRSISPNEA